MNVQWIRTLALALSLSCLAGSAAAQTSFDAPPLVPVPQAGYPAYPATLRSQPVPPAPAAPGAPAPAPAGDMATAMENAGCAGGDCGMNGDCCANWYVGANFLYLRRDRGNRVDLSFDNVDRTNVILTSRPCNCAWESGLELTLGKCIGCGCGTAIEASYWGVTALDGSDLQIAAAQATGQLDTLLDFTGVNFQTSGNPVAALYDTAAGAHMVVRDARFHNVEINLVHAVCGDAAPCRFGTGIFHGACCDSCDSSCCRPCASWGCTWLAGVRYFQYYDNMLYATSDNNEDFVFDANEAYYGVNTYNHLIGGQIGARLDYNWGRSLTLFATPKVGIYGNHINHQSRLVTLGDEAFDIRSTKDDLAILAELSLGADLWLTSNIKLTAGYRVVAVSGVAGAEDQFNPVVANQAAIADIDSSGEVILHGAFAGFEFLW